jgi:hypothetical protein
METAAGGDERSIVGDVRYDVGRLHAAWMSLRYPRQFGTEHSVLGKWQPETTREVVGYRLWSTLGVVLVAIGYPLAVFGFATRFYSRKFDSLAVKLGLVGVVVLTGLLWGGLTILARARLDEAGFLAVGAAAVAATVASAIAVLFTYRGGRLSTIVVAYPAAMTAIFLPPAVAAIFSTGVATDVYPTGERLARFLLEDVLGRWGYEERLKSRFSFDRQQGLSTESGSLLLTLGTAHVLLWFAISVPLGWILGIVVSLANLVRPTPDDEDEDDAE